MHIVHMHMYSVLLYKYNTMRHSAIIMTFARKLTSSPFISSRIWFWVKEPTSEHFATFNWSRDSVYIATILLGMGGTTILVLSMAMISHLVGEFAVSIYRRYWLLILCSIEICNYHSYEVVLDVVTTHLHMHSYSWCISLAE